MQILRLKLFKFSTPHTSKNISGQVLMPKVNREKIKRTTDGEQFYKMKKKIICSLRKSNYTNWKKNKFGYSWRMGSFCLLQDIHGINRGRRPLSGFFYLLFIGELDTCKLLIIFMRNDYTVSSVYSTRIAFCHFFRSFVSLAICIFICTETSILITFLNAT